jgi:transposase
MANLTAAQIKERGKELKPARLLAFKLWKENPQITNAELDQALKKEGFEVVKTTSATWLTRFKKRGSAIRTSEAKRRKAQKPSPARLLAFKLWEENPQITGAELEQALKEKGFETSKSTCYLWLKSFSKGKGVGTYAEKPVTAEEPSEITLEQIIKAAGSVETLSLLFYQGVMREMARKDANIHLLKQECVNKDNKISGLKRELNEVTRDRNQIMRDYNEKLARVKVGTLTLDEAARRLIPKL